VQQITDEIIKALLTRSSYFTLKLSKLKIPEKSFKSLKRASIKEFELIVLLCQKIDISNTKNQLIKMNKLLSISIASLLFATVSFSQKTYMLNKAHSRVGFSATHFGISHVEGNFRSFDATLEAKKEDLTDAVITFTADVNSINTGVELRDSNLKSADYFDAAKFSTLSFKSTSFEKTNGKNYKLFGNILMHDISKPIVLNVVFNGTAITAMKKLTAGFTITGKLNRLDFEIGSSPLTGVSNEIELKSNLEFTISN